jgi:hypothetical protein
VDRQAAHGVSGPGGQLPYVDQIQRAFGGHDLSGVRAHVDERAAAANAAMGSMAYTRGEHIAFGASPDLHTAAHEAAHVLQQRAGVNVAGGVGARGDAHEQQANAVADSVVAGRSAASFIAAFAPPSSGGATVAVQHQSHAATGGAGVAAVPASGGAAAPVAAAAGGPVARVQAAIAARDVEALGRLQAELRGQAGTTPGTSSQDVRDAQAAARRWEMQQIAAIRTRYASELQTAARAPQATAPADPHAAPARGGQTAAIEAVEVRMDRECATYLDALLQGDPQQRYQMDGDVDHATQTAVFAAVRLHAVRRGVGLIGSVDAEHEARTTGGLPHGAWCGAFAYTQANQAGGMDSYWAENMAGVSGIRSALRYSGMQHVWIWTGSAWVQLAAYHGQRGSSRQFETVERAAPSFGIQPGDIVLIDNSFGTDADHVTTAISFDGDWLTTVGGNQGTGRAAVARNTFQLSANAAREDVTDHDYVGPHPGDRRELRHKPSRVHSVGRWSVVDFERHVYMRSAQIPTAAPPPSEFTRRGAV